MDTARAYAASDPDHNWNFRRRWDAPPLKVKRAPTSPKVERPEFKTSSSDQDIARIFSRFKHLVEVAE